MAFYNETMKKELSMILNFFFCYFFCYYLNNIKWDVTSLWNGWPTKDIFSGYCSFKGSAKIFLKQFPCCLLRSGHAWWGHRRERCPPAAPTKITRSALLTNGGSPCLSGPGAGQAMTQRQTKCPMTMEIRAHRVTRAHRAGDNTTGLSLLAPVCSALPPVPSCLHSHTQKHKHTHSQRLVTDCTFSHDKGFPTPWTDRLHNATLCCTEKER